MLRQPLLFAYWLPKLPLFWFTTARRTTLRYLLLAVERLCDLRDVIPRHWSPDASHPPFTDLRQRYLLSDVFYLILILATFKASLGPAVHPQR